MSRGSRRAAAVYGSAAAVCIVCGLGSRAFAAYLPEAAARHLGDALWAAMIYCAVRAVMPRMSIPRAMLLGVGICYAVEFSQLYQADWLNAVRRTLPGRLVLGQGFLYVDLVRYAAGTITAAAADRYLIRRMALGRLEGEQV